MSPQQQNVQVTQVVKNEGCLSGCGTVFAIAFVIGLYVAYWYVAVPVTVLLLVAAGVYWYQRRGQLPEAKPGPLDPWLNQVAQQLVHQGLYEKTRNTGQHLEGVPVQGELILEGHGTRVVITAFSDAALAMQAASRLKAKPEVQAAMSSADSIVLAEGQVLYVAGNAGQAPDQRLFTQVLQTVNRVPLGPTESSPTLPASAGGPAAVPAPGDALDQLRKLGELRDAGTISEEDFQAKKTQLLDRL